MSSGYVVLIIVLVLGFIIGNLMMLKHMSSFNISPELRNKINLNKHKTEPKNKP